jgi:hypothetical protein
MAYWRELWRIVSGSEVRFICNITLCFKHGVRTSSRSLCQELKAEEL